MTTLRDLDGAHVYLDSNILIYAFEGVPGAIRDTCGHLLAAVHAGRCVGVTSLLSRAEVLVRPLRDHRVELADRYRRLLSGAGPLVVHALDNVITDRAAELRANYSALRLPDALHVATALRSECDLVVSSDLRLRAVSARIPIVTLDAIERA